MNRYAVAQTISALDPERDHQQICHLLAGYEFPWDMTRALELALLRTFCVPAIAQLLARTGELEHHSQKRYDDTGVIVSEILKHGYDSDRGRAFLERMNAIHRRYSIRNEDFLYVLSTFIYEPVRWCDRFGWRSLSGPEKQAFYRFWCQVGDRMGLEGIPSSYEAFERYNRDYEAQHFRYSPANQQIGDATLRLLLSWFPPPLRPLLQPSIYALLDGALLGALGWQAPPAWVGRSLAQGLRLRSYLMRQLPARRKPDFFVDQRQRSYPRGYSLHEIGPTALLADLNGDRSAKGASPVVSLQQVPLPNLYQKGVKDQKGAKDR